MSTPSLTDFLTAIEKDADLRAKLTAIPSELAEEDFASRVATLAADHGYGITTEEVAATFYREPCEAKELSDQEMESVAGGADGADEEPTRRRYGYKVCYKVNGNTTCHFR